MISSVEYGHTNQSQITRSRFPSIHTETIELIELNNNLSFARKSLSLYLIFSRPKTDKFVVCNYNYLSISNLLVNGVILTCAGVDAGGCDCC